jgi:hypothetical protein
MKSLIVSNMSLNFKAKRAINNDSLDVFKAENLALALCFSLKGKSIKRL